MIHRDVTKLTNTEVWEAIPKIMDLFYAAHARRHGRAARYMLHLAHLYDTVHTPAWQGQQPFSSR